MNGTASALLAIVGAFFIAAALHGCDAEARPGDYTKRACARGSTKACARLCERGFRGYCRSNVQRVHSRTKKYIYVPTPMPRVPLFEEATEDEGLRAVFTADDAPRHLPADAPTFRVDAAFNVAASEPLVPYRVRKLSESDMARLAEQWQSAERLPQDRNEEPRDWRPFRLVLWAVMFGLSIALFHQLFRGRVRRRRPATYPHDPYLPTM